MQRAYDKYGIDSFTYEIVEECDIINRLEREIYYISLYKSHIRDYGYNIYSPNEISFMCSEDTKEKMRGAKSAISIPIDLYDLQGNFIESFESIIACARSINVKNDILYGIITNKRKRYKQYTVVKKGEPFLYIKSSKDRNMSKFYK